MPTDGYVEFSYGPVPFRYIEWLEIRKTYITMKTLGKDDVSDKTEMILGELNANDYITSESEYSFVIYGYKRATQ